jgi:putative transposase
MSNTYTKIHLQFIFAVQYRAALIDNEWKERLHQYITGIFQSNTHKMLAVNSMPDHIHILAGMRPTQSISDIIKNVKSESSKWINENNFHDRSFRWQEGYGAFSYSESHVPGVIRYIQRQEQHHKKATFLDEYKKFLRAFNVDYEERYLFKELV